MKEYLKSKVFRKIVTDFSNIIINKRYNLEWMYFTASPQLDLSKFRKLLLRMIINLNAFFIKQGADMMLDNEQEYI